MAENKRLAWALTAVLIGFSRVAVTAHYLSDIVMGGTLAVVITVGVQRWFEQNNAPSVVIR